MTTIEVVEESEQPAIVQSGQAQHVTILMPVDAPTDFDHTSAGDGATADPLPAYPPGQSAVAVDRSQRVPMDAGVLEPNTGDTTEDTDFEDAGTEGQPPELAGDADSLPNETEPRMVDMGWGIFVGEISREDLNEILSFPKLFPGHW